MERIYLKHPLVSVLVPVIMLDKGVIVQSCKSNHNINVHLSLTREVRDLWSDVLRSSDDGIGMTVGLELSQPARQCDDKLTASVGSKLARLWGLNLYGERRDDRGTLSLNRRETNFTIKLFLIATKYCSLKLNTKNWLNILHDILYKNKIRIKDFSVTYACLRMSMLIVSAHYSLRCRRYFGAEHVVVNKVFDAAVLDFST